MDAFKKAFQGFDPNNLDLNTAGNWPIGVKVIFYLIVLGLVSWGGVHFYVQDKHDRLEREISRESELRKEFESKSFQVANLSALRKQMEDVEDKFSELLRQLPTAKEVPGLLEDITDIGRAAGLEIKRIALEPEKKEQFYIELPINIEVQGTYHQMGQFVSGVAAIKRIVTLHNYKIVADEAGVLQLKIDAKTYRYDDSE
ncbi:MULTISPECIES: type 4a pilus biogenesis protein PilO [Neptunomonas]|uniref:Pilus assembly protein PilP n=1 Tax=Neptunomonas marina TaxID=1815562 RepID=A0A437QA69_9GAMM|nr:MULTISPECIES: type 4a pilus biogenesis protein PilO [Neptunomonas]RVU31464.1 pilus assembly protein PilP [Neptunomonas marina]